jgi:hypothetical protein
MYLERHVLERRDVLDASVVDDNVGAVVVLELTRGRHELGHALGRHEVCFTGEMSKKLMSKQINFI